MCTCITYTINIINISAWRGLFCHWVWTTEGQKWRHPNIRWWQTRVNREVRFNNFMTSRGVSKADGCTLTFHVSAMNTILTSWWQRRFFFLSHHCFETLNLCLRVYDLLFIPMSCFLVILKTTLRFEMYKTAQAYSSVC